MTSTRARKSLCSAVLLVLSVRAGSAQWKPTGALATIPVIENCAATAGDIAVFRKPNGVPTIFYCQSVANAINARFPEAGRFYYVHEFAHAAGILDEDEADCWAARQLTSAPNGRLILRSAIAHFKSRGQESHPGYSAAADRADNIARCAGLTDDSSNHRAPSSHDVPATREGNSCESEYQTCVARVRTVDQCVSEEYPKRCIETCMKRFGFSREECTSRRCLPTRTNMDGWRSRCASLIDDDKEQCSDDRKACQAR
jgi:hypothetical protein